MSIFSRVRDLLSANINAMLDNAEDPEKMADEYLRQLNNELYEAKTSVAAAMADAMKLNTKETQYGAEGRPDPHDLVEYLDWCQKVPR